MAPPMQPEDQSSSGQRSNGERSVRNEHTALLSSMSAQIDRRCDEEDTEEDSDIEPNEFDNLLCRSESYSTGLGIEPLSYEAAMLRGLRKYNHGRNDSRRSSHTTLPRQKSFGSFNASESAIEECEEETPQSPFLAGVSVARFWLIFSGILISYFIACFDSTIMVSSHPIITSYFHSSNSASWLSTAFLLTSTSFQPVFGRLSDTIGRKPPYVFTMAVFLVATVWCGVAQSMMSFIIARAVCGLGAGGMMTMGSIITSDLVPIEIRGVYQSYINIVFGAGSALGAALGGAIADHMGWRWEFYIQIPAITICLATACLTLPKRLGLPDDSEQKSLWQAMKVFDIKGSLLLTSAITFLILGLNLGGNVYDWSHPFVITSLLIFSICFPLFIYVELHVDLPIMPVGMLTRNPRAGLIVSNFVGTIIANSVIFNIPLFFQAVLLESATDSGLRLVVPSIASSTIGTLTGFLITYTKRLKFPIMTGTIFTLLGTIGLSLMRKNMPDWAHVLFLIPTSMGQGFLFPGTFMAVLAVSEKAEQAVVTSTLILWRSMGNVLGVAVSSLVLQNALRVYLLEMVVGDEREEIIAKVRASVRAIATLEQPYRDQVVDAYAASLSVTFMMAACFAVVGVCLVAPLKLPRLGRRK